MKKSDNHKTGAGNEGIPFRDRISVRMAFTFFISIIIIYLITIAVIYYTEKESIVDIKYAELNSTADLRKTGIHQWLEERNVDIRNFTEETNLEMILMNRPERRYMSSSDIQYINSFIYRYMNTHKSYEEIYMVNAKTLKIDFSSDIQRIGEEVKDTFIRESVIEMNLAYGRAYKSRSGAGVMPMALPISVIRNGKVTAACVVVFNVNLENIIKDLFHEREGLGETGEILIVNTEAYAIMDLRWRKNAAFTVQLKAAPSVLASRGNEGIIESLDYRDVPVIAAYRFLPSVQWGMEVKQDKSEIFRPIYLLLERTVEIFIIGLILIIIIIYIVTVWNIKPLLKLNSAIGLAAQGRYDIEVDTGSHGEIGQLARNFTAMSASLKSQFMKYDIINEISRIFSSTIDFNMLIASSIKAISELMNCQTAVFYYFNKSRDILEPVAGIAQSRTYSEFPMGQGIVGEIARARKVSIIRNISPDTEFLVRTGEADAVPSAMIYVPLVYNDELSGIMVMGTIFNPGDDMEEMLKLLAGQFAIALNNAINYRYISEQSAELSASNEELKSINEVIKAQSIELEKQASELKKQRNEVEEANRLKSEFLSNMSHELRTPLNSILALSQGLVAKKDSSFIPEEIEYLEIIERNGQNLLKLINDILDLAKIESGKSEIVASYFTMEELVYSGLSAVRPLADKKGLKINVTIGGGMPKLFTDFQKLKQALVNITGNAVKFTDSGGIDIACEVSGDMADITVSDTGIGIRDNEMEYIFNEFRQVDGSTTRRFGGTGLGLSITKKLLSLLGGEVSARSMFGSGSTFTMKFPISTHDEKPVFSPYIRDSGTSIGEPGTETGGVKKLLIIEDNRDVIVQLVDVIKETGFDVEFALNGRDAIELAKKIRPDGIILDLMMPGMDGFEVLNEIRKEDGLSRIPVLILTAKDLTKDDFSKLRNNNVQQLIQKGSVNRDELIYKIESLLGHGREKKAMPGRASETLGVSDGKGIISARIKKERPGVLIIEDNADNIVSLKLLLQDFNCDFLIADRGLTGLEIAEKENPDLILLDIYLPDVSGFDILQKLKAGEKTSEIPVIAVTAKAMKGDREDMLDAGFDDYLSKPLERENLRRIIGKYIEFKSR